MSWGTGGASGAATGAGQSTAAMGSATGASSSLGYGAGTAMPGLSASGAGAGASMGSASQASGAALPGQMADLGSKGPYQGGSGFSAGLETAPTQGPTVANASSLPAYTGDLPHSVQAYDLVKGKSVERMTDQATGAERVGNVLDRFGKGQNQSLGDTVKGFGNNPETYGALYKYLSGIASMGGGKSGAPAPIPINTVYQQPQNDYLKKYYGR
jgi:hypothetical protein